MIPPNDGSNRFDSRREAVIFLAGYGCFPAAWLIGGICALLGIDEANRVAGGLFVLGILLLSVSIWYMRRSLDLGWFGYAPAEMIYPSTFRAAWRRARNG